GSALEESATVWTGGSTVENPALPPRFREAAHAAAGERVARYEQARSVFEDAIASGEGLTLARVRLGRVRWRLGEREAARAARAGRDAYRDYLVSDAVRFREELAALRQESLQ